MQLNKILPNEIRLIDVFITGPLQIYISTFLKNEFLKYFMLITGILNIIYNGHNYLLFNNTIKQSIPILQPFVSKDGKYQLHRIYNLVIMYPIFLYIALYCELPYYIRIIFFIDIFIGFLFNLYNFIKL